MKWGDVIGVQEPLLPTANLELSLVQELSAVLDAHDVSFSRRGR